MVGRSSSSGGVGNARNFEIGGTHARISAACGAAPSVWNNTAYTTSCGGGFFNTDYDYEQYDNSPGMMYPAPVLDDASMQLHSSCGQMYAPQLSSADKSTDTSDNDMWMWVIVIILVVIGLCAIMKKK